MRYRILSIIMLFLLAVYGCGGSGGSADSPGGSGGGSGDGGGTGGDLTTIFTENFETGWGSWSVSNGVWEIGTPTSGPNSVHGGTSCAATVLAGNYPADTDSRLVSPIIQLSNIDDGENLFLRFCHWFSFYRNMNFHDYGVVQIQTFDESTDTWSSWVSVSGQYNTSSAVWSLASVDLTSYAGMTVRISFSLVTDNDSSSTQAGWYIDDLDIARDTPAFSGDFESGWNGWSASNGVWEIGTPASGPESAYSGTSCAATILAGNYPADTDSRLVTPIIQLNNVEDGENLFLRFWHWFSFYINMNFHDYGVVQIQTFDESTDTWSSWVSVSSQYINASSVWTYASVDLTSYAGMTVRIGFSLVTDNDSSSTQAGWYIDDLTFNKH